MSYWHNERTGETEYRETPSDFLDYLPQSTAALNLYKLYIEHEGLKPLHAYIKVMEFVCGVVPANKASPGSPLAEGEPNSPDEPR